MPNPPDYPARVVVCHLNLDPSATSLYLQLPLAVGSLGSRSKSHSSQEDRRVYWCS